MGPSKKKYKIEEDADEEPSQADEGSSLLKIAL